jgi:hypothetical protein
VPLPGHQVLVNAEKARVGAEGAVVSTLMSGLVYVVALPSVSNTM